MKKTTVLCYGDSNTYGYTAGTGVRYDETIRWPRVLQTLLGDQYYVVEEGLNGRTTDVDDPNEYGRNGLAYLRPCLNSHKPIDIVLIMLGTNDTKIMYHRDAKRIAQGAANLVDETIKFANEKQEFMPKIVLVSPIELGDNIEDEELVSDIVAPEVSVAISRQFAAEYKKVADEKGVLFFDAAKFAAPSDIDKMHLTAEGHLSLARAFADLIKDM